MASSKVQVTSASLILMVMIMVTVAPQPTLAMDCGRIVFSLMPCLGYLTQGGPIPAECCGAVKKLAGLADTTPARREVCQCIKPAAKNLDINYEYANKLPSGCNVDYEINLGPNIDCSKVE